MIMILLLFLLPASEFILAQAHFEAIASWIGGGAAFDEAVEFVVLDSVDAPGSWAWTNTEARFLGVDGEHGKLWFG